MNLIDMKLIKTGPEIVTLENVKKYLRISHDENHEEDDQLLKIMIKSAREIAENFLGWSIVEKEICLTYEFSWSEIIFPCGPVREILKIEIEGEKNVILENDAFSLGEGNKSLILNKNIKSLLLTPRIIKIFLKIGPAEIPASFELAQLIQIAAMFDCRGSETSLPMASKMLYGAMRERRI